MNNIDILNEVEKELMRFIDKLHKAKEEQETKSFKNRDYAACKRAALDLKRVLTNLTQDSKYKYHG